MHTCFLIVCGSNIIHSIFKYQRDMWAYHDSVNKIVCSSIPSTRKCIQIYPHLNVKQWTSKLNNYFGLKFRMGSNKNTLQSDSFETKEQLPFRCATNVRVFHTLPKSDGRRNFLLSLQTVTITRQHTMFFHFQYHLSSTCGCDFMPVHYEVPNVYSVCSNRIVEIFFFPGIFSDFGQYVIKS